MRICARFDKQRKRACPWTRLALPAVFVASTAVVYLGEYCVIDAINGWIIAVAGWMLAGRLRRE